MTLFKCCLISLLFMTQAAVADRTVLVWETGKSLETSYDTIYKALENNNFFVVFEPDIQKNLSFFAERWGDNYNRNKLEGIRSMIFCNGWYANAVSNADPDMMALCPLHITLVQKDGVTRILFSRPTVIAAGSKALSVAREIEQDVSKALDEAVATLKPE
ncbi:hypothetical protein MNBD_GAMMA14-349 [hydrothermal vent metagenome]|uniref:DUF302 domain-containing protein n=1 Tax=hydrothermal vent metagenome TaxID=652676 RepID=A0A3B0YWL8_9ZZZZ